MKIKKQTIDKPNPKIWDLVSKKYTFKITDSDLEIGSFLLDFLGKNKKAKKQTIAEFGSGSGHISAVLAQKKFNTTLVDFSTEALKKSKLLYSKLNLSGNFINADILNFHKNTSYDLVWNSGVMEHFNDKMLLKAFEEIYKHTNSYFIFIVPNPKSIPYLLWRSKLICEKEWDFGYEYLRDNYEEFIEHSGFLLQKKTYIGKNISSWQLTQTTNEQSLKDFYKEMYQEDIITPENYYLTVYVCKKNNNFTSKDAKFILDEDTTRKTNLFLEIVNHSNLKEKTNAVDNLKNDLEDLKIKNQQKDKCLENLKGDIDMANLKISQLSVALNKIYNSKTWRLLYLYKKFAEKSKNCLKLLIPIKTRKAIVSSVELVKLTRTIKNKIPEIVISDWQDHLKSQYSKQIVDYIIFSVIAWDFRYQRPQQLSKFLAQKNEGTRVFYIKNEFLVSPSAKASPSIRVEKKESMVYEITLSASKNLFIYSDTPTMKDKQTIFESLKTLIYEAGIINPIAVIDHPFWANLLESYGMPVIYDCMDNHQGFLENDKRLAVLEQELFTKSDIVLTTSKYLSNMAKKAGSKSVSLLPNAGDYKHFAKALNPKNFTRPADLPRNKNPIVGYYGAIAEWFDTEILSDVAQKNKDKTIVLIGSVTNKKVVDLTKINKNIYLLGEKPYSELPAYLAHFDVCIIPFKLTELIKATHPVKVFEYLAAGKPIVASRMPEISNLHKVVTFASKKDFSEQINFLLKSGNQKSKKDRQKLALKNTWIERADKLTNLVMKKFFPKVSIVVLSYNKPEMLKKTLDSIIQRSYYSNLEVIVVDNASNKETISLLENYKTNPIVKVIYNKQNYGFAKGNNIGLKVSTGDYIVVLNNDVIITPGWISRLIFHLSKNKKTAIVGPVTNNIGNEAKIDITYDAENASELEKKSREYTSKHWNQSLGVNNLAAFCWIFSRKTYKEYGGFDERYGMGLFEDDDYCYMIKKAGLNLKISDDVFVHHFGSMSFKQLNKEKYQNLFNDNKRKFETKWKIKWKKHVNRNIN